jgi:hypothetical protein
MTRNLLRSLAIGILTALLSFGAAYVCFKGGWEHTAWILYWQGYGLQRLMPCNEIGTQSQPFCEGTPLNLLAFFAGIPLGILIYSTLSFLILEGKRRAKTGN